MTGATVTADGPETEATDLYMSNLNIDHDDIVKEQFYADLGTESEFDFDAFVAWEKGG
jgi:hypothetical protein